MSIKESIDLKMLDDQIKRIVKVAKENGQAGEIEELFEAAYRDIRTASLPQLTKAIRQVDEVKQDHSGRARRAISHAHLTQDEQKRQRDFVMSLLADGRVWSFDELAEAALREFPLLRARPDAKGTFRGRLIQLCRDGRIIWLEQPDGDLDWHNTYLSRSSSYRAAGPINNSHAGRIQ